jgi:hypothetical protein
MCERRTVGARAPASSEIVRLPLSAWLTVRDATRACPATSAMVTMVASPCPS